MSGARAPGLPAPMHRPANQDIRVASQK